MMGSSIPSGRRDLMAEIFSRTSCTARSISLSKTNSTVTRELPSELEEVMLFTPFMVFTACSMRSVIVMSIISGLAPRRRVVMLTTGKSTFGKRSTPISG